jgi:hypothetical protein
VRVRLLSAWSQFSKGHIIPEMPGGMARTLILRGIAEEVVDQPVNGTGLKAILQAPVDRMMRREKLQLRTK